MHDYDKNHMEVKFNYEDDLCLNNKKEKLKLYGIIVVVNLFSVMATNTIHKFSYMIVCVNQLGKI